MNNTTFHVRRAKEGDTESLAWLHGRFRPLLLAQARYRLGKTLALRHDPEDLVQDTWTVALSRLASLKAREGRETPVLLKYLSTTLLYQVNNLIRRSLRRADLREADLGGDPNATPPLDLRSGGPGVPSRVGGKERRDLVSEALDSLSPRDREVVILRGIEQLDTARVAEILEASEEAVSSRYRRALARLRSLIPDSVFEEL